MRDDICQTHIAYIVWMHAVKLQESTDFSFLFKSLVDCLYVNKGVY